MRTAVDTNVFSILWRAAADAEVAAELLAQARENGNVVVSALAYTELLANPVLPPATVEQMLDEAGVQIDFNLSSAVWKESGLRFARFCDRRRRSGGGEPRRLLADFVIGAHALHQCDRLLTFDTDRFRIDFPELDLMPASRSN